MFAWLVALGVHDRPGNGAQCSLMEHIVHAEAGLRAVRRLGNIALQQLEPRPPRRPDPLPHVPQIPPVPGREIVQPHDLLVALQQQFEKIRTDEASHTGHQPPPWRRDHGLFDPLERKGGRHVRIL